MGTPAHETTTIRHLRTERGHTVDTPYTDDEALRLLEDVATKPNQAFAVDLLRKSGRHRLSADQMTWVHILVVRDQGGGNDNQPRRVAPVQGSFAGIVDLMTAAGREIQWPCIAFEDPPIRLKLAGARSRFPGSVNLVDEDGQWWGRIHTDGRFERSRHCTPEGIELLRRLEDDPAEVTAEEGRRTGRCCYCRRGLTDGRSLEAGYGPVCAERYQLPWG